jgi:hypothetical protein
VLLGNVVVEAAGARPVACADQPLTGAQEFRILNSMKSRFCHSTLSFLSCLLRQSCRENGMAGFRGAVAASANPAYREGRWKG